MQNYADGQTEKLVDCTHPLRVARGQVIVHRHDVDTAPGEGVEINGQRRDERLAFARGHFGYVAGMQGVATNKLHIERNHFPANRMFANTYIRSAQTTAGVFHHGKGFGQNFLELGREFGIVLDLGKLGFPLRRLCAQFVIGKLLQDGLKLIDAGDHRTDFFYVAVVLGTEKRFE